MTSALVSYSASLAVIDESQCIGCTLCIKACPFDAIIGANKQMHSVVSAYCTGCKLCLAPCPMDCITMQDNLQLQTHTLAIPEFQSHNACTRCDQCIQVCPRDLDPGTLYSFVKKEQYRLAEKNSVAECADCGECDKACPNAIPLSETFRYAKNVLRIKFEKKSFTQACKQRKHTREIRLNNDKQDQVAHLLDNKQRLAEKLTALKKSLDSNKKANE